MSVKLTINIDTLLSLKHQLFIHHRSNVVSPDLVTGVLERVESSKQKFGAVSGKLDPSCLDVAKDIDTKLKNNLLASLSQQAVQMIKLELSCSFWQQT